MALDMFLNMGDTIKGETKDKAQSKKHDIDILSWSWGMTQSGTMHSGGGGGSGKASFQDISVTKYIDTATNGLMMALAKGSHIKECVLLARKAGAGQETYIKITMKDVIVTSISTGGSGGQDRLTENVSLNFASVDFEYTPQTEKGTMGAAQSFKWDIEKNSQG